MVQIPCPFLFKVTLPLLLSRDLPTQQFWFGLGIDLSKENEVKVIGQF